VHGPLAGGEGVLEQVRSSYRVILSVSLIQRSMRIEVDQEMVLPIVPAGRMLAAGSAQAIQGPQ